MSNSVVTFKKLQKRVNLSFAVLNLLLWAWFWSSFFLASRSYPQPLSGLDDSSPPNVVFYREAWVEGSLGPRTTVKIASFPSWLIARLIAESISDHWPGLIDKTLAGTTLGGSVLLTTMCLTFVQWRLFGMFVARLLHRTRRPLQTA